MSVFCERSNLLLPFHQLTNMDKPHDYFPSLFMSNALLGFLFQIGFPVQIGGSCVFCRTGSIYGSRQLLVRSTFPLSPTQPGSNRIYYSLITTLCRCGGSLRTTSKAIPHACLQQHIFILNPAMLTSGLSKCSSANPCEVQKVWYN